MKSLAAMAIAIFLVGIAAWRGVLSPAHLDSLSGTACFIVGLVGALATGLVSAAWRPGVRSRDGVAIRGDSSASTASARRVRPQLVPGTPHEIPPIAQRVLLLIGFTSIALVALGNHAAARIVQLPEQLSAPSPSTYCMPAAPVTEAAKPEAPPPPPVDQAGCALVKRAFELGYTKSLGTCAPKQAAAVVVATPAETKHETCTRRQLDEPMLHYGYRRVAGALGAATSVNPIVSIEHRVDDVRAHIDYLDGLLADIRHAITGSPHAAHHLWVNLADPHPGSVADYFVGAPRCSTRFANLPLWPRWSAGDDALVVEHVLGQLLFATRFGTTASCNDYVIHWNAPVDACDRLAKAPIDFLADTGGLGSIRAVLDRRHRQIQLAALAKSLGRPEPPPPPPVSAVVSMQCLIVGSAVPAHGTTVQIDGDDVGVREVRVTAIKPTGDGPIDVYLALAALLGGTDGRPRVDAPPL
ncbi:MAG TPA: hypothetical protein VGO00_03840, partial [Kofleriaceae bacterium]|nr:hypothetical protein [Kofleriaceae bacterium]